MYAGDRWRLGHRPGLDGLRGVAILLVLAAHFDNPATSPLEGAGQVGVTLFFSLSGFLITALLLEEHDRTGRVSLAAFYGRRAQRLLPALATVLTFVAVMKVAGMSLGVSWPLLLAVAFYYSNYYQLAAGAPYFDAVTPTWSLSIEEHFYLVWPLLFIAGSRWGRRGIFTIGAVLGGGSVLLMLNTGGMQQTWGTPQRAWSLLAGCLLAVWMNGRRSPSGSGWVLAGTMGMFGVLAVSGDTVPTWAYLLVVPCVSAAALWAASGTIPIRPLENRVLRWFGKRSYGIYLWHYVMIYALPSLSAPWPTTVVYKLPISLLAAELSWRLVEARFLVRATNTHVRTPRIMPRRPEPAIVYGRETT